MKLLSKSIFVLFTTKVLWAVVLFFLMVGFSLPVFGQADPSCPTPLQKSLFGSVRAAGCGVLGVDVASVVEVKPSASTARVTWSRAANSVYELHWFEAYNTDSSWSAPYAWTSDNASNLRALTEYRHTNDCDSWPIDNLDAWDSSASYLKGKVVSHDGRRYQSVAGSIGVEPGVTANWKDKWTGPGCTYEPLTVTNFLPRSDKHLGIGSVSFKWGRQSLYIGNPSVLKTTGRWSQCTTSAISIYGLNKQPITDSVENGAWCWQDISDLKPSTGYTYILERFLVEGGQKTLQGRWMSSFRTDAEALDDLPLTDITPPASVEVQVSGSGTVVEGGDAVFTVSASTAPTADLTVTLDVEEAQGTDLNAIAITGLNAITIPAGKISATYTHTTHDDTVDLGGGSVTVTISSGNGYTVSGSQGSASMTITDNDACAPYEASDTALLHVATWQAAKTGKRVWQRQLARALAGLGAAEHDNPMNSAEAYRRAGNRPDVWTVIADEIEKVEDGACSD